MLKVDNPWSHKYSAISGAVYTNTHTGYMCIDFFGGQDFSELCIEGLMRKRKININMKRPHVPISVQS